MRTMRTRKRSLERICLVGIQGVGKSFAYMNIANKCKGDTIWILDNDNTVERLLEEEFTGLAVKEEYRGHEKNAKTGEVTLTRDPTYEDPTGNVILIHTEGWEETKAGVAMVRERAERNDWCVIDSVTSCWEEVQEWFVNEIFENEIDRFFMEVRAEKKREDDRKKAQGGKESGSLGAFDGWKDWNVINSQYKKAVSDFLKVPPCHLLVTAEQAKLGDDEKEARDLYGAYGVKPKGQKRTGHDVQTVLLLIKRRDGTYYMTTMKDRGREDMELEGVSNFAMDYLFKRAGWGNVEVEG